MTSKSKIVPIAHAGVDSKGYHLECPRCDFRAYGRSDSTDEDAITKGSTREYVDHFIATHVDETN